MTAMRTAVAVERPQRAAGRYDRIFYSGIAIGMALTVFVGFGSTYYWRLFGNEPPVTLSGNPLTPLIHVHVVLFTAWVILFLVQTTLIAQHKTAIHRRLGVAGALLAASMVVVGGLASIEMAERGVAPPGMNPLSFLLVVGSDMLVFGVLVAAALLLRANREAHKRLMLVAYVSIIGAAVARFPGVLEMGPVVPFSVAIGIVLMGVLYDLFTRGRVHRAYLWGGGGLVLSVPLRMVVSGTDAWKATAQLLINLAS
jgi:hypothetical protein